MLKYNKPPYGDTTVDADKTQSQITQLLRKYGVSQINWQVDYDMEQVVLDFVIEYQKLGQQEMHKVLVHVKPPMFVSSHRTWNEKSGKHVKSDMANWAQSMRLLFHWIKAKLEAVSFGLNSVEKEFLSDILTKAPDGTPMTIWELRNGEVEREKLMIEYKEKMQ